MRILLAGTNSGCGKTTATLLLLSILKRQGFRVAPYKTGPDYIDPGFHRAICDAPCHNLDTWLMTKNLICRLLSQAADIAVIEGVMGYYDGFPGSFETSTWALAHMTNTPVILVVNASGGATSTAATVLGFQHMQKSSHIAGVLLNQVSSPRHYILIRDAIEHFCSLPCVGYLEKQLNLQFPSRHLGLVPSEETPDLLARIHEASLLAEKTLDIQTLLSVAETAGSFPASSLPAAPDMPDLSGFRMGVAKDTAFHFYYDANLDQLTACGATLVPFSPMHDPLPDHLDGLYIGGGFPELFLPALSGNTVLLRQLRDALSGGLPAFAECGGLMYLGTSIDDVPVVGFLPVASHMTPRLQHFGYTTVQDRTGLIFPAHEFHHAISETLAEIPMAFQVTKASDSSQHWNCGYELGRTLATYSHIHFAERPDLIRRIWL